MNKCTKCGSTDVGLEYIPCDVLLGTEHAHWANPGFISEERCETSMFPITNFRASKEFLFCTCDICGYKWATDVLTQETPCSETHVPHIHVEAAAMSRHGGNITNDHLRKLASTVVGAPIQSGFSGESPPIGRVTSAEIKDDVLVVRGALSDWPGLVGKDTYLVPTYTTPEYKVLYFGTTDDPFDKTLSPMRVIPTDQGDNPSPRVGKCARRVVIAVIVKDGVVVGHGSNACLTPQGVCPRADEPTGVGYEKCRDICGQRHHAEVAACLDAGSSAAGGTLHLFGHTYTCQDCLDVMRDHGVILLDVMRDHDVTLAVAQDTPATVMREYPDGLTVRKYIEERFPQYFIHGWEPCSNRVNVVSTKTDEGVAVTEKEAEWLIADRKELIDMLRALVKHVPEDAFNQIWYETEDRQ